MVIMAIDIVEQTSDMLAQRVIEDQRCVSLRTAYGLRLLEQIRQPTVIDTVLDPWRFGEEAGEVRFVRTLEHTASNVRQAFIVQGNQALSSNYQGENPRLCRRTLKFDSSGSPPKSPVREPLKVYERRPQMQQSDEAATLGHANTTSCLSRSAVEKRCFGRCGGSWEGSSERGQTKGKRHRRALDVGSRAHADLGAAGSIRWRR